MVVAAEAIALTAPLCSIKQYTFAQFTDWLVFTLALGTHLMVSVVS